MDQTRREIWGLRRFFLFLKWGGFRIQFNADEKQPMKGGG